MRLVNIFDALSYIHTTQLALHIACRQQNVEIVKLLLQHVPEEQILVSLSTKIIANKQVLMFDEYRRQCLWMR